MCAMFDTSEEDFLRTDPMALIRAYVDKHNLRLLDLFNSIDKDRNFKISQEEFANGMKVIRKYRIRLTRLRLQSNFHITDSKETS